MIKTTPVIKKGASIKINVIGHNLLLQAEGISLEDGQIGDKIKVRRSDSGKVFQAIVVDSEVVEVKL
jgi:flagella basal body P-ring formation protein FlgA